MEDALLVSRMNEIESLILRLTHELRESRTRTSDSSSDQRYYSLREAVRLKYGPNASYTTISTNYALMPCGNTNFEVIGGVRRWRKEFIQEWIDVTDRDIPAYLERYNVPLRGRIGEKYLKKYGRKEVQS